ncbi:MAG TPA: hypothetical protein DCZ94_18200 [Lentisphaeria bacterium]|nr:MAG: hypothetical protein A2X48_22990 [Lentisphaerae bacterium GWF2_49_21]HBC88879.1 hypothetical protein [Lentisphaeria bacterium]
MRNFHCHLICILLLQFLFFLIPSNAEDYYEPFSKAEVLESEGKAEEAFLSYCKIPGAQHKALKIALVKPEKYLELLQKNRQGISFPISNALEGDLLLKLGRKNEALMSYRAASSKIGTKPDETWEKGFIPEYEYITDCPIKVEQAGDSGFDFINENSLLKPFVTGCGSHSDNWLIRRFIALEAWEDAEREFDRIWNIHRKLSRPYIARNIHSGAQQKDTIRKFIVQPYGFDGQGLRFSIDYAFFEKQCKRPEKELKILLEPVLLIDMDRNPLLVRPTVLAEKDANTALPEIENAAIIDHSHIFEGYGGLSRVEFIRLAYGAFKELGKEDELIKPLEEQVHKGENRSLRVLAQIRSCQKRNDEALKLEKEYIEKMKFDGLSAAYRLGTVYECYGKTREAAGEYEKALNMPFAETDLPDKNEDYFMSSRFSQQARPRFRGLEERDKLLFQKKLLEKLISLYNAAGTPEKILDYSLKLFDANPDLLDDFELVESISKKFLAVEREAEFRKWGGEKTSSLKSPEARANLLWLSGDIRMCAKAVAENPVGMDSWISRIDKEPAEKKMMFLSEISKAGSRNSLALLELLDSMADSGSDTGKEAVVIMEILLQPNEKDVFWRGKGGAYNRTQFKSYFDLAYRLLRIYLKNKEDEKFFSLGMKMASGDKPFGKWWEKDFQSSYESGGAIGYRSYLNSSMGLLIDRADEKLLVELGKLWDKIPDCPSKRQYLRRMDKSIGGKAGETPCIWRDIPDGVSIITSSDNILSLAGNKSYFFTGHPWGITVYGTDLKVKFKIPLEAAVICLESDNSSLWAGTPSGLFRIGLSDWNIKHVFLDKDVSEKDRKNEDISRLNRVESLVLCKNELWIGTCRNIQLLNTDNMQLKVFSLDELGVQNNQEWKILHVDGNHVWANDRRFVRKTGKWQKLVYKSSPVFPISFSKNKIYGHVNLGEPLRDRPCIINPDTLEVTPFLIEDQSRGESCINGPFSYYGELDGQPVFGPGYGRYVLNGETGKLRMLSDSAEVAIKGDMPGFLMYGTVFQKQDNILECDNLSHECKLKNIVVHATRWYLMKTSDGRSVLAAQPSDSYDYKYGQNDNSHGYSQMKDYPGGLYLISKDGDAEKISGGDGSIPGIHVYSILNESPSGRKWICTDYGLSVVNKADRLIGNFTVSDGLPANIFFSGCSFKERLYFATGFGDHGGGLLVFNPETFVFHSYFDSDGLATNKLADVKVSEGGQGLKVKYGPEYMREADFRYRLYPESVFNPGNAPYWANAKPKYISREEAEDGNGLKKAKYEKMPYIGGAKISQQEFDGKIYICGTRGLVVAEKGASLVGCRYSELNPKLTGSEDRKFLEEAKSIRWKDSQSLKKYLDSGNPYLKAEAIIASQGDAEGNPKAFIPVLSAALDDPNQYVRGSALIVLMRMKDKNAIDPLRKCLKSEDEYFRSVAAISLARLGSPVELPVYEGILKQKNSGCLYYGAGMTGGGGTNKQDVFEALASCADKEVFKMLMKYPLGSDDYEPRQKVFVELGKSLLKHPDAAPVLLEAYPESDPGPDSNYGEAIFSQKVFKYAGKDILPILHKALESENRVVRSNAARACGEIRDNSSIPYLIKALDFESGLSQASIIWALGKLKSKEALPIIISAYPEIKKEKESRSNQGYLFAQAVSEARTRYDYLRDIKAIGKEWGEIMVSNTKLPINPAKNEFLISTKVLVGAVRDIGPELSQDFFRGLAADSDSDAREEAAECLSMCNPGDIQQNIKTLQNMLDDNIYVSSKAAGSLLLLGDTKVQGFVLKCLSSQDKNTVDRMMFQLEDVNDKDPAKLSFAHGRLEEISKDGRMSDHCQKMSIKIIKKNLK